MEKITYSEYYAVSTVEPVLSGHPLLNGQLSKSRKLLPLIIVVLTCIKRSLSDIKLRKPKQQTLISNYFLLKTNRFKRRDSKD